MSSQYSIPQAESGVCFDTELIRRYGGRGPRYTSYPTALQFDASFGAEQYRSNAINSNATGLPLSLYIHIPFCRALCYYCGCNKIVTRNQARVSRYLECLYKEIDMQADLFAQERKVEQLHFGGGTPTYLNPTQLAELIAKLDTAFGLDHSDAHEFSIEVDPRTVDVHRIRELANLGFNRLSLGIQDFDRQVQTAINRLQSVTEVRELVAASRQSGFRSISFDLIYGLPHQTVNGFERTLDIVTTMRPDRLAVYNYAHLPERFKGQRMLNAADLPSAETKLEILGTATDRLLAAGYEYIGMDHFALPNDDLARARRNGTLQRNFQGYSTHRHCDLIGLGVSSISSVGDAYSQNSVSTSDYETALEAGHLPVTKGISVDYDNRLRAAVIQALMCYDELDFAAFGQQHEIDFRQYFAPELSQLDALVNDGLVAVDDSAIRITPTGRMLLRSVAMVFDRYLGHEHSAQRFSQAI